MQYKLFNTKKLNLSPIANRESQLSLSNILPIQHSIKIKKEFNIIANKIIEAKKKGASIILIIGAHVIRSGLQRYLIDLMQKGYISCIAMNGAGIIHDFEFALIGKTTEKVADYIKNGRFGFWEETAQINDIIFKDSENGIGLAVGKFIESNNFKYKKISLLANGYKLEIPITAHISIGCDINHQFPNFNASAFGNASYIDFLKFTKIMESLEYGVVMNFGSAVMGPEVYLKALSMVRNIARQEQRKISNFSTLVCDLIDIPKDYHKEASKDNPFYYFRPWKTMLIRTVSDGGQSYYVKGKHDQTIPQLWSAINELEK